MLTSGMPVSSIMAVLLTDLHVELGLVQLCVLSSLKTGSKARELMTLWVNDKIVFFLNHSCCQYTKLTLSSSVTHIR